MSNLTPTGRHSSVTELSRFMRLKTTREVLSCARDVLLDSVNVVDKIESSGRYLVLPWDFQDQARRDALLRQRRDGDESLVHRPARRGGGDLQR